MQNKHIIRLSFFCIFLSVIVNILLYRQFILHDVILREVSENNKHLVALYKEQVWSRTGSVAKKLLESKGGSSVYKDFVKHSIDFFATSDALKIQIFDVNGGELYASNDLDITVGGDETSTLFEYYSARLDYAMLGDVVIYDGLSQSYYGKQIDALLPEITIASSNYHRHASIIANYIPMLNHLGAVDAVVAVYTDISGQRSVITALEHKMFLLFILLFCIFFAIILYNTNYAQKVIDKQFQINKLLEEAKLKAEDENRSKTEFLANVSHELRTPLNTIIGFSEIILSEHSVNIEPKKYNDYIADILHSGKHLLAMINDILDFSKASADKLAVEMIDVDVHKTIKSSLRFVEQRAKAMGISLVAELPETYTIITADPKRLRQALLNLLSNSVKFTHPGGSITINIAKNIEKKQIQIRVIDTGIGMDEHDIPKALSSFGQVDNSLSRKYEGTGLGLPLTKKLVELMNGKFEISSVKNIGTTVTMTFDYKDY